MIPHKHFTRCDHTGFIPFILRLFIAEFDASAGFDSLPQIGNPFCVSGSFVLEGFRKFPMAVLLHVATFAKKRQVFQFIGSAFGKRLNVMQMEDSLIPAF